MQNVAKIAPAGATSPSVAFNPDGIPDEFKALKRWMPFLVTTGEGKPRKILYNPTTNSLWSPAKPEQCLTFDNALRLYQSVADHTVRVTTRTGEVITGRVAGLGLCTKDLNTEAGLFIVDLDKCHGDDALPNNSKTANEILEHFPSTYVERSVSGRGLHIVVRGVVPEGHGDSVNTKFGVDLFTGSSAKFVAMTGVTLDDQRTVVRDAPEGGLEWLFETYGHVAKKVSIPSGDVPDILTNCKLDNFRINSLPYTQKAFLSTGKQPDGTAVSDGSMVVAACTNALAELNQALTGQQVFSLLANNEHVREVAERHWDDWEAWLWGHHVVKAFDNLGAAGDENAEYRLNSRAEVPKINPAIAVLPQEQRAALAKVFGYPLGDFQTTQTLASNDESVTVEPSDNNLPSNNSEHPTSAVLPDAKAVIEDAMQKLEEGDAGAIFETLALSAIKELRDTAPADWARLRQRIKATKQVPMADLEALTKTGADENMQGQAFAPPEFTPWHEPVDGAALASELSDLIHQHVICSKAVANAAALWVIMTHFTPELTYVPYANITAPTKRCGKTTLLSLLAVFTYRGITSSNMSSAAMFRTINKYHPTLMIDEADAFLNTIEDARGILNAGNRKDGYVIRCVGDDSEPVRFSVFGPKAICGIGKTKDTLEDRSIKLTLKRKMTSEKVSRLRSLSVEHKERLQGQLARFHDDMANRMRQAPDTLLDDLNDRAAENFEPLVQIADLIGSDWPNKIRAAAHEIEGIGDDDEITDVQTELLRDVRRVFTEEGYNRLTTKDLLMKLKRLPEAPWSQWDRGNGLTDRKLARMLKSFGIGSITVRVERADTIKGNTAKGYKVDDFTDAFARYLPTEGDYSKK